VKVTRDTGLGVLALLIAGAYLAEAGTIQQSLLADAVGADGVPRMLAYGMGGVGAMMILRDVFRAPSGPRPAETAAATTSPHTRALGLLAILIAYLLAVPQVGYALSVAGLLAATAVYAGARPGVTLAITAVSGALFFWVMFKYLLGIPMPAGVLLWG
jgi:putative tricarboxylic transport membrane protein